MKKARYYFIQFWAYNNPEILTCTTLCKILYKIWKETYREVPACEQKLQMVGYLYKQRIRKGLISQLKKQKT